MAQPLHNDVPKDCMHVLRQLHIVDIRPDSVLGELLQLASAIAAQAECDASIFIGVSHRSNDVLRVAAAGNRNYEIARIKKVLELLDEDVLEGDVITIRHD